MTPVPKSLTQMSSARAAQALAFDWALVIFFLWLPIAYTHPITFIIAILGMARQQHALAVLMHEAAHRRLFPDSRWNDILGQWLTAAPLFYSLDTYRYVHLLHHKAPLTDQDPDLSINGGYPIERASYWRKTRRDLLGVTFFKVQKFYRQPIPMSRRSHYWSVRNAGTTGLVVNLVLFLALSAAGFPGAYFVLWLFPMMTILQVMFRLRAVAEHAARKPGDDQREATRTVVNPMETWFLAPHGVNYHVEHHLYTTIPFYHLRRAHLWMRATGQFIPGSLSYSYMKVLKECLVANESRT